MWLDWGFPVRPKRATVSTVLLRGGAYARHHGIFHKSGKGSRSLAKFIQPKPDCNTF